MNTLVGIVDYGASGNIKSIEKAIKEVGAKTALVDTPEKLNKVDKIILPGVGSFSNAMMKMENNSLLASLCCAIKEKPTLGICLGMQILSRIGFEFGETKGLGVFDAEVKPIQCPGSIPHMGFNKIEVQKENPILNGLNGESFYFMHSFEVVNYKDILSLTTYCHHEFVSAMGKGKIFGVQFHPEKSRSPGIKLFQNFISI